jgi:chaperonin GroES
LFRLFDFQYPNEQSNTQVLARSLVPLGDRVLVQRAPKVAQTSSGLYLPTDKTKAPNEGKVIAVGPGQMDVTGTLHACTLKAGDSVLLPEYGGTKVDMEGSSEAEGEMFLFRESDILGKYE